MGIRKNAKFLTPAERENFVKACVLLKAQIVNSAAPAAQQYSKWDEYVAIHFMIQQAFAPGSPSVNFGHGGSGAFSFLSWHRYFLYRFELELQAKVAGVMLPYWDWQDPTTIMTDTFLGPNGSVGSEVRSGYFAADAPGTGTNPTPAPIWWPAGLAGWRLPAVFDPTWQGPLRRSLLSSTLLPPASAVHEALEKTTYSAFQVALEASTGLAGSPRMHNGMHTWIQGHMSNPYASPLDPLFYLHHCNIDRLWAMWQADGHASDYPMSGGNQQHHRTDPMYPWVGALAGYGTSASIAASVPMPNFSALGIQRNVDTLDYRAAYGYAYDTIAIIGLALDRTGSMLGLTPDPMTTSAPDVTKWEAAKRGVSAFLQDCETVQASATVFTIAGVKTFRRLAANDFQPVFGGPGYGLIKSGTSFSRATFDSAASAMMPGGGTPLADALLDVKSSLVDAPFAGLPAGEPRYVAMLTDGLLTAGAPMNSIPDGSLSPVAVFSMGFGTGVDVDYATLQSMVDKGRTLVTQQLFHGETAGTIDKFYSNALTAAIGFTSVFDPVLELFAGEHTHVDFQATSADDVFFITAQGMDFRDENWSFALHGPGGSTVYGPSMTGDGHAGHESGCAHCCRRPNVTARQSAGRLSLVLNRDNADSECWVGLWQLMVSYKSRSEDGMVMFPLGSLLAPTLAGTLRGPRYARLLASPQARKAQRNVPRRATSPFDVLPASTNRNDRQACDVAVNIYARTRLALSLVANKPLIAVGEGFAVHLDTAVFAGNFTTGRTFARLVSPGSDIPALRSKLNPNKINPDDIDREQQRPKFDAALALASAEQKDRKLAVRMDTQMQVAMHEHGPLHVHVEKAVVQGPYNLSLYVEGDYCPEHGKAMSPGGHSHMSSRRQVEDACGPDCVREPFFRLLSRQVMVAAKQSALGQARTKAARKKAKRR